MEYSKAIMINKIVDDIRVLENQIEKFDSTKEFCNIEFKGENGNERKFIFSVSDCSDIELNQALRTLVADKLKARLDSLINELSEL